jgi:site-specific recombinase XerD
MDDWGWQQIQPWLEVRKSLPIGQIFCVLTGATAGRAISDSSARGQIKDLGKRAGVRRRVHPHGLRHSHAVDLWREGVDVYGIQTQLGHARLDVTAAYLRGVAVTEVLAPIRDRKPPMMIVPS